MVTDWREINETTNLDQVDWELISLTCGLPEDFIEKFQKRVHWPNISRWQTLSESFIDKFKDLVSWGWISRYQVLSERFIDKFKDLVSWVWISEFQVLSESFIDRFKNLVSWPVVSRHQVLSEVFIEKHKDRVCWRAVSCFQTLSEVFMEKFKDWLDWYCISQYQKLSEEFAERHKDWVNFYELSNHQYLSQEFREKHRDKLDSSWFVPENNWLYADIEYKLNTLKECGLYQIEEDYVIAYKGVEWDGRSIFNSRYRYQLGGTYESRADHNLLNGNSFGLSAWTYGGAKKHCDRRVMKVKIHIDDLAAVVPDLHKLRATRLTVIEDWVTSG